jgi:hypothetical protein
MRSRTTFATMDAAATDGIVASPPITVWTGQGRAGGSFPSTIGDVRHAGKGGERPTHGGERGLPDVDPVDLGRRHGRDSDGGRFDDLQEELVPALRGQHLGIGEAVRHPLEVEHDSGRHDRPGEGPAPDLVQAGYRAVAAALQLAFAGELEGGRRHVGRFAYDDGIASAPGSHRPQRRIPPRTLSRTDVLRRKRGSR